MSDRSIGKAQAKRRRRDRSAAFSKKGRSFWDPVRVLIKSPSGKARFCGARSAGVTSFGRFATARSDLLVLVDEFPVGDQVLLQQDCEKGRKKRLPTSLFAEKLGRVGTVRHGAQRGD